MRYCVLCHICFCFLFIVPLWGQEKKELFFTYAGPVAGTGWHTIEHKDWFTDKRDTLTVKGMHFQGGVMCSIIAVPFSGVMSLQYQYNNNDDEPLMHLYGTASARYVYEVTPSFLLSSGPGIYFESPPSSRGYDGGSGLQLPLGLVYFTTFDTALIFDIVGRYGSYAFGEESRKISAGVNLGFLFKVGRI